MECGKAGAVRPTLPKTNEPNRKRAALRLVCGYSSEAKLVVPGWRRCSDGGANPPTSTFLFVNLDAFVVVGAVRCFHISCLCPRLESDTNLRRKSPCPFSGGRTKKTTQPGNHKNYFKDIFTTRLNGSNKSGICHS